MFLNPAATSRDDEAMKGDSRVLLLCLVLLFGVILLRTAWLHDDAFITLRVVDNFRNGHGLRWNVIERVQTYTHPLWLLVIIGASWITSEIPVTTVAVGIALSLFAMFLLLRFVPRDRSMAVVLFLFAILSRGFVEYSTGGLENPLSHVLYGLFLLVLLRGEDEGGNGGGVLCLLFGLSLLTRPDFVLLMGPSLLFHLWRRRSRLRWKTIAVAVLPVLLWEVFAMIYYGFPFGNPVYSKLGHGILRFRLIEQGVAYLISHVSLDPTTIFVIVAGIFSVFLDCRPAAMVASVGLCAYLAALGMSGGDYMLGRMLTTPFLGALILLGSCRSFRSKGLAPFLAIAALLAHATPESPVTTDHRFEGLGRDRRALCDERGLYFSGSGMLSYRPGRTYPIGGLGAVGRFYGGCGYEVVRESFVGAYGFCAGPKVHFVDDLGICDPLLSRLPSMYDANLNPGHYRRLLPERYHESVRLGENRLAPSPLKDYLDLLWLVTRGPILSWERFVAIVKLNAFQTDPGVDSDAYRFPDMARCKASELERRPEEQVPKTLQVRTPVPSGGVMVSFETVRRAEAIEIVLGSCDNWELRFRRDGKGVGRLRFYQQLSDEHPLARFTGRLPEACRTDGFDAVHVLRLRGGRNPRLGYLCLLGEEKRP